MDQVVGTCSLCGGAVALSSTWMATVPQVPTCRSCGATKKQPHGPVIEMEPRSASLPAYQAYRQAEQQGVARSTPWDGALARQRVEIERFWQGDGWRPS